MMLTTTASGRAEGFEGTHRRWVGFRRPSGTGDKGLLILVRAGMNERVLGLPVAASGTSESRWRCKRFAGLRIMKFDVNTEHWVPKTMVGYKQAPASVDADE
ncbi:partition protein C [Xanthomonas citri]|uniref:partition protein C n=1 Tax=Xanthomonas citri TaxID=346 RepID=UPI001F46E6D4|nr:partition protein C [Xanthomonas citri]